MSKDTLKVIVIIILSLAFLSHAHAEKYTIGLSVWSGYPESVQGFKAGLSNAGINEGDIDYIYGKSAADKNKQQAIAEKFKSAKVDLVYSLTTPGTVIIKDVLPPTTPIVFSIVTYPADSGLIESFEYSANNLVGTSNFVPLQNYVDLLISFLPTTKTAAIFHRKGEPNSQLQSVNLRRLLRRQNIKVLDVQAESLEEIESKAKEAAKEVDVFITTTDTLLQSGGESVLIRVASSSLIPILSSNKKGIVEGSTFGPVADFYILGKLSGEMAAKILKKEVEPKELHSRLQDPPSILVNKKALLALGITVPEKLKDSIRYVD